jgi:hypothetical protein
LEFVFVVFEVQFLDLNLTHLQLKAKVQSIFHSIVVVLIPLLSRGKWFDLDVAGVG